MPLHWAQPDGFCRGPWSLLGLVTISSLVGSNIGSVAHILLVVSSCFIGRGFWPLVLGNWNWYTCCSCRVLTVDFSLMFSLWRASSTCWCLDNRCDNCVFISSSKPRTSRRWNPNLYLCLFLFHLYIFSLNIIETRCLLCSLGQAVPYRDI